KPLRLCFETLTMSCGITPRDGDHPRWCRPVPAGCSRENSNASPQSCAGGYHAGQRSLEFLCFFIIKFSDKPASAVGRNSHHKLALFTNYFHWAITGTGLHSSHYCSFLCASSPRRERFAQHNYVGPCC